MDIREGKNVYRLYNISSYRWGGPLHRSIYLENCRSVALSKMTWTYFRDLIFHLMKAKWDCYNCSKKLSLLYLLFQHDIRFMIIIIPKLIKEKIHHCLLCFLEVAHYVQTEQNASTFYMVYLWIELIARNKGIWVKANFPFTTKGALGTL